jgi:hypothetical protein
VSVKKRNLVIYLVDTIQFLKSSLRLVSSGNSSCLLRATYKRYNEEIALSFHTSRHVALLISEVELLSQPNVLNLFLFSSD